tara:strand:- start:212 stop:358 length:147 start_codon:yes stop_codon:yes gene_type:complete
MKAPNKTKRQYSRRKPRGGEPVKGKPKAPPPTWKELLAHFDRLSKIKR